MSASFCLPVHHHLRLPPCYSSTAVPTQELITLAALVSALGVLPIVVKHAHRASASDRACVDDCVHAQHQLRQHNNARWLHRQLSRPPTIGRRPLKRWRPVKVQLDGLVHGSGQWPQLTSSQLVNACAWRGGTHVVPPPRRCQQCLHRGDANNVPNLKPVKNVKCWYDKTYREVEPPVEAGETDAVRLVLRGVRYGRSTMKVISNSGTVLEKANTAAAPSILGCLMKKI